MKRDDAMHNGRGRPLLYGIGLGPGDPELVTFRALRVLKECRALFVPDGGGPGGSRAYRILESLDASLLHKTRRLALPMGKVKPETWRHMAMEVLSRLLRGSPCGFAVEGDPLLYGSFIRLYEEVLALGRNIRVQVISGIPSFCAAAARLRLPLASGRERMSILAGPLSVEELSTFLRCHETLVLLKANTCLRELEQLLESRLEETEAWLVEDCGMPTERMALVDGGPMSTDWGYFTLAILRKKPNGEGKGGGRE